MRRKQPGVFKYTTKAGHTRWGYIIDLHTDYAQGNRRQRRKRGFATQADAADALTKARNTIATGSDYFDAERMTFLTYLDHWIDTLAATGIKERTLSDYRNEIRRYIRPHMTDVRLQKLSPLHLEALYRTLTEHGGQHGRPLGPHTVIRVHRVNSIQRTGPEPASKTSPSQCDRSVAYLAMSGDHADERSEALQTDFFREQRSGLPSLLDKNAIESMPVPPTLLIDSGGSSVVATDVVSVDWWAEDGAGVVNVSEFDASPAGNTPSVGYDGRARLQLGAAVLPSRLHFLGFSEVGPDGAPSAPPVVELECHYLEDTECLLPRLSDSGSVEIEVSAGAPVPLKLLVVQVAWYTSSSVGIPQVQATWAIPVS